MAVLYKGNKGEANLRKQFAHPLYFQPPKKNPACWVQSRTSWASQTGSGNKDTSESGPWRAKSLETRAECGRFIVTDDKEGPDSVFQKNLPDVSLARNSSRRRAC